MLAASETQHSSGLQTCAVCTASKPASKARRSAPRKGKRKRTCTSGTSESETATPATSHPPASGLSLRLSLRPDAHSFPPRQQKGLSHYISKAHSTNPSYPPTISRNLPSNTVKARERERERKGGRETERESMREIYAAEWWKWQTIVEQMHWKIKK